MTPKTQLKVHRLKHLMGIREQNTDQEAFPSQLDYLGFQYTM